MRSKISLLIVCLLLAACGTHRQIESTSGERVEEKKPSASSKPKKSVEYTGSQWVTNASRPFGITKGLQNKHISLWASHGRYFNQNKNRWEWQRPYLFCTTEDLYTQTIVVPYLIPMLEKAGATVFTPRERDWQRNEVIVDNDDKTRLPYYTEINVKQDWKDADIKGFASQDYIYSDGVNPFTQGTTRMAKATKDKECEISYQPNIPREGSYAVYVSYPTHAKSVPDAQYTVYHKGQKTTFKVNQQMGGGTWVYLGTFDFDAGCDANNRVVLTNVSSHGGVVTADAVRFGGGMGNIKRNGKLSSLPRAVESARYYAQWAGAPESVYLSKQGTDDYKEDINARPLMTNWLAGGSCFNPAEPGLNVPLEVSLGVHSDAGVTKDYSSLVGTLTICTTNQGDGLLASGLPRSTSKRFASLLLDNAYNDITAIYSKWQRRVVKDQNYAESRVPKMTSALIETLSHQNFPDMVMGQDPNLRFTLARSVYKSILRLMSEVHDKPYVVAPLTPMNFRSDFCAADTIILSWEPQKDAVEPTATPTAYVLYTATGTRDFDNGTRVNGTACKIKLQPNILYNFKIAAINDGGESFPSEVISVSHAAGATKRVMIVNGFQRLSAPAIVNDDASQGFDLAADPGVWQGKTMGLSGRQIDFDKRKLGVEGPGGLGYSGSELEGLILMGNEFNYTRAHALAIMAAGNYDIASCSRYAVEKNKVNLGKYDCVDLILGLEKDDGHSLRYYKTFTPAMRNALATYTRNRGNLIVSGAYIASDMTTPTETDFLSGTLHVAPGGAVRQYADETITGMGTSFDIYCALNEEHYATPSIDIVAPVGQAFSTLTNHNGNSVCVAYDGKDYRSLVMGFPFECIKSGAKQASIMKGFLDFIFKSR